MYPLHYFDPLHHRVRWSRQIRLAHFGIPQPEHQLTEKFRGVKPFQFSFRCYIPLFTFRAGTLFTFTAESRSPSPGIRSWSVINNRRLSDQPVLPALATPVPPVNLKRS